VKLLEEKNLDATFGITNDFNGKRGITTVTLLQHKVCVICSSQHPWATRSSVSGIEISDQPIITLSPKVGDSFYCDFIKSFEKDGILPNIIKEVDTLDELFLSVRINEGIALTSREVITSLDDLAVLDIENTHHHAAFCIGYQAESDNVYLQAFIEVTKQYFQQQDDKKNL
jgi:DNA-binding transcriptional LysR family regulator